jgi:hypothetical protein
MTDLTRPTRPDLTCDEVRDLAAPFVLDALDAEEADAVRAHLATCADPHPEFAELAAVVPILAETVPVRVPSPALKTRLMAAAAADLAARHGALEVAAGSEAVAADRAPSGTAADPGAPWMADDRGVEPAPYPGLRPVPDRSDRIFSRRSAAVGPWALRIAAVVAIVALAGWNLLLQSDLGRARDHEQRVAAVLDVAGQPGALTAVLRPQAAGGPTGLAAMGSDGIVRLAMRELAPTSGDEVYEAWVIGPEAQPVAIGGFRVDATGTGFFEASGVAPAEGIVLALTLEPAPGATAPTSTPVAVGTVTAG